MLLQKTAQKKMDFRKGAGLADQAITRLLSTKDQSQQKNQAESGYWQATD